VFYNKQITGSIACGIMIYRTAERIFSGHIFLEFLNSALIAVFFPSIYSVSKCFTKNPTLKISSAASQEAMVSVLNVAFPWPPVMAAHDPNRLATTPHSNGITVSRKTVVTRRTRLCSSDHMISFRLRWRQFPIKIAFAITITWAQGQMKERVVTYLASPVFPMSRLIREFSDPIHLTTLVLQ